MPREAKLFDASGGSPMRALFKLRGNVPPNWIGRARRSRKSLEPDLAKAMKRLRRVGNAKPSRPAKMKKARQELQALLRAWELSYRKESFYRGVRILLEVNRDGKSGR